MNPTRPADRPHPAYRAAYWLSTHCGASVRLTSLEHADLPDEILLAIAHRAAVRAGLDLSGGKLVVGIWQE